MKKIWKIFFILFGLTAIILNVVYVKSWFLSLILGIPTGYLIGDLIYSSKD